MKKYFVMHTTQWIDEGAYIEAKNKTEAMEKAIKLFDTGEWFLSVKEITKSGQMLFEIDNPNYDG